MLFFGDNLIHLICPRKNRISEALDFWINGLMGKKSVHEMKIDLNIDYHVEIVSLALPHFTR